MDLSHIPQPGDCLAVCAACGARVVVPPTAGFPPVLSHVPYCPRAEWPFRDAILYDDGTQATVHDWPNGVLHPRK